MRAPTIEGQPHFDKSKFVVPRGCSSETPDWTRHVQLVNCHHMPLLRKWLGLSVIALVSAFSALADQQSAGNATVSDSPLSADELKNATSVDALTVPTPGEFFKAIEKGGKPNWTSQYRPPDLDQIDRSGPNGAEPRNTDCRRLYRRRSA